MHPIDRRLFCVCLIVFATKFTRVAEARDARGLDGTWGGAQDGVTAQVIIVGRSVIGFFWRKDYLDALSPKFSGDGSSVSFAFHGGNATLTLIGEGTAHINVNEGNRVVRMNLRRD